MLLSNASCFPPIPSPDLGCSVGGHREKKKKKWAEISEGWGRRRLRRAVAGRVCQQVSPAP